MEVTNKTSHILTEMPKRNPTNGTFELTVRCNLHCKMCMFRHDDKENPELMEKELTTEQWIDMARQTAEAGTMSLLITGGEPMLRPDFCEIWEGIYKFGFIITLYTNATLVTPKIMETLQKYPPHKIGVTIYGASPETYEKVCGKAEAFQKAIEGMHQLLSLPSGMEFRTTIIKDNYADALAIEKLIHTEFGEQYKLIQTRVVTESVRGACADVSSCRLEPQDNVRLAFRWGIEAITKIVGDSYDEKNLHAEYVSQSVEKAYGPRLTLLGCNAGMSEYTISWDGLLLGCQMLGNFFVDTQKDGFLNAWKEFPSQVKLPNINEKCMACKSLNICNCCYASRYAETGDLGGCPEYVCRDTEIINRLLKTGGIEDENGKL